MINDEELHFTPLFLCADVGAVSFAAADYKITLNQEKTVETSFIIATSATAKANVTAVGQPDSSSDFDKSINDPRSEEDWHMSCWKCQIKSDPLLTFLCISICSAFGLVWFAPRQRCNAKQQLQGYVMDKHWNKHWDELKPTHATGPFPATYSLVDELFWIVVR